VTDMIFATKIRSTAVALGIPIDIVRSNDAFAAAVGRGPVALAIVDMDADCDAAAAVGCARERMKTSSENGEDGVVLAYCSHVDVGAAAAAKQAGADVVWPRSRFSAMLAEVLSDPSLLRGGG